MQVWTRIIDWSASAIWNISVNRERILGLKNLGTDILATEVHLRATCYQARMLLLVGYGPYCVSVSKSSRRLKPVGCVNAMTKRGQNEAHIQAVAQLDKGGACDIIESYRLFPMHLVMKEIKCITHCASVCIWKCHQCVRIVVPLTHTSSNAEDKRK